MSKELIPEFEPNEYLNTSAPYEYLYTFHNDKFKLAQMREKMKVAAAAVGVKGFIGLWNAYLEGVKGESGDELDNVTCFDGQSLELFCGNYVCDEYGVAMSDNFGYEVQVCKHPILPIQRLVNIDTGEERLRIAFKKGRQWRSVVVEKTVIAGSTSIISLAANGVLVNSENAKQLSTYLFDIEQLNYDRIPEQNSVGHLGWVGEHGFSPYMDNLVFDGESSFRHVFNSVHSKGSFDAWKDAMLDLRQNGAPGRLFLAASFASAVLSPCGLLPFFLHAWGGTETGKTVGLMIAASVWASPKMGEYICTFNSTQVAQELYAGFLNSLPMCIDELQIQSSLGLRDFDRIIYQLTEGVGKSRGAKSGGLQRLNTWKNCILTSGEQPISSVNSGGGAVNRIIEFECAEKIYSDLPGICSIIAENYGFAGKLFTDYLQEEGVIERVRQLQKDYYQQLIGTESTDKQVSSASVILAADAIATELIFQDGNNLTVDDLAKITTKKDDVNVCARAFEYALELVARNPNRFATNGFGEYQGEVWGAIDSEYIYFIKSVFDREIANAGFNGTAMLSWAKRTGKTVCEEGRKTKRKQLSTTSGPVRCVCIKRESSPLPDINDDDIEEIF